MSAAFFLSGYFDLVKGVTQWLYESLPAPNTTILGMVALYMAAFWLLLQRFNKIKLRTVAVSIQVVLVVAAGSAFLIGAGTRIKMPRRYLYDIAGAAGAFRGYACVCSLFVARKAVRGAAGG